MILQSFHMFTQDCCTKYAMTRTTLQNTANANVTSCV